MEGERFSMAAFADGGRDCELRNAGSHEKLEKARLGNRPQSLLEDTQPCQRRDFSSVGLLLEF